jgi:hypothetical protein
MGHGFGKHGLAIRWTIQNTSGRINTNLVGTVHDVSMVTQQLPEFLAFECHILQCPDKIRKQQTVT